MTNVNNGHPSTGTVPPPKKGLGSNSNYVIAGGGTPLTGVDVAVATTQALVNNNGFTVQLNAYPPTSNTINPNNIYWWQFTFAIAKYSDPEELLGTCWVSTGPGKLVEIGALNLPPLPPPATGDGPTLPADYTLAITLTTDATTQAVTSATYTVTTGSTTNSVGISIPTDQQSPIMAFDLVIVGHAGGETATFTSGAGSITYAATTSLSALSERPPYAQGPGTAEKSNSVYATLPEQDPITSIVQGFTTGSTSSTAA